MRRKIGWVITIVFWTLVFCFPVMADMGPKPEINISVVNFPEEEYYLDLLIEGDASDYLYNNLRTASYEIDPVLIELLRKNREAWWQIPLKL